jgi:peptidoglycan/xylan/chitin deacetylase (PgdA/CDA1 family)
VSLLSDALKSPQLKRVLYTSGALDAWHRRRNRDRLTVIMFHRVLPVGDARWPTSDPEYTLALDLFEECLRFFKKHYNVVGLDDVLGARELPERSLLITFDDGWSDNEEFALPALRRAGLPAVIFVVAEAVGRSQPFWQEQMITAWKSGRLMRPDVDALWKELGPRVATHHDELAPVRDVIAAIEQAPAATRERLLDGLGPKLDDGVRYMITKDQLLALAGGRIAIGAHGATHAPLTEVPDVDQELATVKRVLEQHVGKPVATLSFPHGKWDERVVARARAQGYRLLFTSVPELPPARGAEVLGRVGFTGETITGRDGRFAPELLALHLFRKPHGVPSSGA